MGRGVGRREDAEDEEQVANEEQETGLFGQGWEEGQGRRERRETEMTSRHREKEKRERERERETQTERERTNKDREGHASITKLNALETHEQ